VDTDDTDAEMEAKFRQIISELAADSDSSDSEADYWAIREFYEARAYGIRLMATAFAFLCVVAAVAIGLGIVALFSRL
jgi:hypothetical protein